MAFSSQTTCVRHQPYKQLGGEKTMFGRKKKAEAKRNVETSNEQTKSVKSCSNSSTKNVKNCK